MVVHLRRVVAEARASCASVEEDGSLSFVAALWLLTLTIKWGLTIRIYLIGWVNYNLLRLSSYTRHMDQKSMKHHTYMHYSTNGISTVQSYKSKVNTTVHMYVPWASLTITSFPGKLEQLDPQVFPLVMSRSMELMTQGLISLQEVGNIWLLVDPHDVVGIQRTSPMYLEKFF